MVGRVTANTGDFYFGLVANYSLVRGLLFWEGGKDVDAPRPCLEKVERVPMYQKTWVFKINPEQNFDENNKRDQEKQQPEKMAAGKSRPIPGRTIKTWKVRRHRMNHRRKIWSRIHTALFGAFLYIRFLNKLLRSARCQWELGGRFQILRNCVDIILTAAIRFRPV